MNFDLDVRFGQGSVQRRYFRDLETTLESREECPPQVPSRTTGTVASDEILQIRSAFLIARVN